MRCRIGFLSAETSVSRDRRGNSPVDRPRDGHLVDFGMARGNGRERTTSAHDPDGPCASVVRPVGAGCVRSVGERPRRCRAGRRPCGTARRRRSGSGVERLRGRLRRGGDAGDVGGDLGRCRWRPPAPSGTSRWWSPSAPPPRRRSWSAGRRSGRRSRRSPRSRPRRRWCRPGWPAPGGRCPRSPSPSPAPAP